MNNVQDVWGKRFSNYISEVQRYLRFVFTGHLVLVIVFIIGAGGYAYSNWLKEVPTTFPAACLTAILVGLALSFSSPITLLKPADLVFFLPLERQLSRYMKRALKWTFFAQLPLPLLLYLVATPLLAATTVHESIRLLGAFAIIILLKWLFVEIEYVYRHALAGQQLWLDRVIRFLIASVTIYLFLMSSPLFIVLTGGLLVVYHLYWRKKSNEKPFPYVHFIESEQNRMMRFYRFANYFTDVPHLKGSISRRSWLNRFMVRPNFSDPVPQLFLVSRTMIRTDDLFWLWMRLFILSIFSVLFIPYEIILYSFVGAFAFASTIQLLYSLQAGYEFRMDLLFPQGEDARQQAIVQLVRRVQWIQTIIIFIIAWIKNGLNFTPLIVAIVMIGVSEMSLRFSTRTKKE